MSINFDVAVVASWASWHCITLALSIAKHRIKGRIGRAIPFAHSATLAMKMIAEYLEHAIQFERMARETADPILKQEFLKQAGAYRKMADKRAAKLGLTKPP
jgi:hypothetical protein